MFNANQEIEKWRNNYQDALNAWNEEITIRQKVEAERDDLRRQLDEVLAANETFQGIRQERDDLRCQWTEIQDLLSQAGFVGHHPRGAVKLLVENRDDLRRQLAEAQGQRNKAWVDGAALTAEMLDAADLLDAEGSSIGNDLRKVASDHSPGAPMVEELAALRKVLDAGRWAYNYDVPSDVDTVTIRADEWYELRQANHEYDALDATRNREGRHE